MKRIALFLALAAGLLWGSTGPFVRILSAGGLDNVTIFFARVLIATIILFIAFMIKNRSLFKFRLKDIWIFLVYSCIATTGLNICYNVSIINMSLSFAAVLLALAPVYVVFLAYFLFKEKITAKKIICMLLAVFGCVLVSGFLESSGALGYRPLHVMIGVLSGILYAVQVVFSRLSSEHGYKSFTLVFYCMLFATILLAPFSNWHAIGHYVQAAPLAHIGILIVHSLLAAVIPYICINTALAKAEAGICTILCAAGEPTAATLYGALFFAEIPSVLSFGGLVLTIIALSLLLAPGRKKVASNS